MIGIYKITCKSTKKVYIGQSIDIFGRFKSYQNLKKNKSQVRLYNSFRKYGLDNHLFEIIVECDIEKLNDFERYYQDLYSACGKSGLNCLLTHSKTMSGRMNQETRDKIGKANKGRKNSPMSVETRMKIRLASTGRKHSDQTKIKIGAFNKGHKYNTGRKHSELSKMKMSIARKGVKTKPFSEEAKSKMSASQTRGKNGNARKVIDTKNMIIYDCAKDAADTIGMNYSTFQYKISGLRKNDTQFIYYKPL